MVQEKEWKKAAIEQRLAEIHASPRARRAHSKAERIEARFAAQTLSLPETVFSGAEDAGKSVVPLEGVDFGMEKEEDLLEGTLATPAPECLDPEAGLLPAEKQGMGDGEQGTGEEI